MFLNVGLYVWGRYDVETHQTGASGFNMLALENAPELLACVAVGLAAIPTAYTAASGVFVIAAGSVIYHELREAGARRQLALAATAMSGSLGVVLRPVSWWSSSPILTGKSPLMTCLVGVCMYSC